MTTPLSRRAFAGTLGLAAGAALVDSPLGRVAEAAARRPRPAGAVILNSNENPYGPFSKALEALGRAGAFANRYPDALEDEVRAAIAKHHGVAIEQVVLGCGSSEILQMADEAFAGPGGRVVAAQPTFEAVLLYAAAIRAEGIKVPLTAEFRHDLPAMAAAAREKAAGLVYVCNPNNPTGTVVSGAALASFVESLPASTVVLVDEAYHHFVEDPGYRSAAGLIATHPNVVVARTFSKIYGLAGMRLGYAVGSVERIAAMAAYASFSNANAAVLGAAAASLDDAEGVARTRKKLNDTRCWLSAEMARQGRRTIPSEANFMMIEVGRDVAPVIDEFRKRNILVGRRFPSLERWLRITVGTPDETAAFAAALAEIVPARAAA
ncbi:MAG TPA: aminotransferase class I/II-fold pyridoxal phosphate-dependent enzyme [Thermoanaerobaculia bacterium]|nr:aminotransferase class I/II-fold pyridoxal phosphate-dependent enzyme [Thermoanaerobaculia bacterium]